jgi:hypothetical protein
MRPASFEGRIGVGRQSAVANEAARLGLAAAHN